MMFRRNQIAAWTAILAIALQAVWPLVANARPSIAGELVPVCTVAGVTHNIELPAVKTPLEKSSESHGDHCKLCVFGVSDVAVVRDFAFTAPESENQKSTSETQFLPAVVPLPAQPRAPPVPL